MEYEKLSQEFKDEVAGKLLDHYAKVVVLPIVEDIRRVNMYLADNTSTSDIYIEFVNLYKDKVKHEQLGVDTLISRVEELDTEILTIGGNTKFVYWGVASRFYISGSNPLELAVERITERLAEYDSRIALRNDINDFDDEEYYWLEAVINGDEYSCAERDTLIIPALMGEGKSMTNRNKDHYAWAYSRFFGKSISIDKKVYDILKELLGDELVDKKCQGCDEVILGSKTICPLCRHKYVECSNCGKMTLIDDIVSVGGRNVCKECNSRPRCRGCGTTLENEYELVCPRCSNIRGILEYHAGIGRQDMSDNSRYKIGYEVEKEDVTARRKIVNRSLLKNTGWVAERDGSLDESGFELVSPVLPLDIDILEDILTPLESLLEAQVSERCGGHIHISDTERTPHEILLDIRGYLPLLYSLYPDRAMNEYCEAKEKDCYIDSGHRQALNITRNTLEFRIFPAVKNKKQLLFRTRILEYILKNKQTDIIKVGEELLNEDSKLYKLLNERISKDKIKERAKGFIDFANYLDRDALIIEGKKVRRTITVPKIKIDKDKVFERKALAIAEQQKERSVGGIYNTLAPIGVRDYGYFANLVEE
jgi:hypothetical protein